MNQTLGSGAGKTSLKPVLITLAFQFLQERGEIQMRNIQIALILILLAPFSIFASDFSDLSSGKAANYDQSQRRNLAQKLHELFKSLDDAIPSLKPSEQKWVNEERKTIDSMTSEETRTKRLVNLHESVEFQQENMKQKIKLILDALKFVMQAEEINKEIYWWSVASFHLTDKEQFDGGIAVLKNGGRLYETTWLHAGGPNTGYGYFYNSYGRSIQKYYVIPYLAGSLRK